MEDSTPDHFVNRDDPIPVIRFDGLDGSTDDKAEGTGKPDKLKAKMDSWKDVVSRSKIGEKLVHGHEKPAAGSAGGGFIQDRIFTAVLQHMVPTDEEQEAQLRTRRPSTYVEKPNFSLPVMSSNFRRFNARIGVAFVFQARMIRLFAWKKPTQTLSFLAMYTFICLDPHLLPVVPLALCLFFIMIPAFLTRHPPPPAMLETDLYPLAGPPLAPPRRIRPAPDLSKDFFRNMRDLQNSMEDFSQLHDFLAATIGPLTNFSNEAISSELFLVIMFSGFALFIFAHLLPWRVISLAGGWFVICSGNKSVKRFFRALSKDPTAAGITAAALDAGHPVTAHPGDPPKSDPPTAAIDLFTGHAVADIVLAEPPEQRQVEIFELQRRDVIHALSTTLSGSAGLADPATLEGYDDAPFEPYVFAASPHTPLAPARIAGERPKGTRFFEDVKPPEGWEWADKKWVLDLSSREWVEERCITGVEVEVEGERWVWDILYDEEEEEGTELGAKSLGAKGKSKAVSWEVGNGTGRTGEWRRRRWVRMVKRKMILEKEAVQESKL